MYIDPHPDDLSSEELVIKGVSELMVKLLVLTQLIDFKFTIHLGDPVTKTITADVPSGGTAIVLDTLVGIHTGDLLSGVRYTTNTTIDWFNPIRYY